LHNIIGQRIIRRVLSSEAPGQSISIPVDVIHLIFILHDQGIMR